MAFYDRTHNYFLKEAFNNYVDKKRVGVSRKSTVGHVTKDR